MTRAMFLVVLDGETGSIFSQPTIPPSTIGWSTNSCDCFTPMGQPIVDADGSIRVEYEVREIPTDSEMTSILWLLNISPDSLTTTTTQLSSSVGANLFLSGCLSVLRSYVATYPLPNAPTSLVTGPGGLPINPPLVLGENGTAFASYGPNVTSFNINGGSTIWNAQAAPQTALSIVSVSDSNGLVAKSTDQSGTDTVVRFTSGGQATSDSWTGQLVDYNVGNAWFDFASGSPGRKLSDIEAR
jgi:hypothetical protein